MLGAACFTGEAACQCKLENVTEIDMKALFTASVLLVLANFSMAQELNFNDLGMAHKGQELSTYIARDGSVYKVGDRVQMGMPSNERKFTYITQGVMNLMPSQLSASATGEETEIKKMWVVGNEETGYSVTVRADNLNGLSNYTIQFENAVSTNELIGNGMTREQALDMLNKAQEKLKMGLITQEEFDRLKGVLNKFIQ